MVPNMVWSYLLGKLKKFVVVDLYNKRNAVCVFTAHNAQYAICTCYGIATAFCWQA